MQSYEERLEENICFRATPTERIALERLALREDRTPSRAPAEVASPGCTGGRLAGATRL